MPTAAGRRKPAAVKYRWRLAPTPCERPVKPDCRVVEHFLHIPPDGDVFRHGKDGVEQEVVGGSGRPVDGALLSLSVKMFQGNWRDGGSRLRSDFCTRK